VLPTTTASLADLGTLVLSDHALDLEKQFCLRGTIGVVIEEDNLNTRAVELVDEHNLVGEIARQAIWAVDVKAVEGTYSRLITKLLQSGPD
jgi:hypothetical protein